MDELLEYLFEKYNRTKWQFTTTVSLVNKFGKGVYSDLDKLRTAGYVKRREGINGTIVELIKFEK